MARPLSRFLPLIVFLCVLSAPGAARAACADPAGTMGEIVYNSDESMMQYCDDADWVAMGKNGYIPQAVNFDGTNDYLTTSTATGPSSTTLWSGSFWVKRDTLNVVRIIVDKRTAGGTLDVDMDFVSGGGIDFRARNSSNTVVLRVVSRAITDTTNWHHVMFSFDLSDTGKRHIYIDGVSAIASVVTYNTAETMDFSGEVVSVGATNAGVNKLQASLADVWVDYGFYIDLSVLANREKFINNGRPVYLGSDGSLPTGAAPEVFMSGAFASWHTNKGTGGGFTLNGALGDAGLMALNVEQPVSGLVSRWKLDETTGAAIADSAGSNNGTWADGSGNSVAEETTPGVIGTALDFDGTDDNISVPYNASLSSANFTIMAWVKADSAPVDCGTNCSEKIIDRHRNYSLNWSHSSTPVMCEFNNDVGMGWEKTSLGANALAAGRWYHMACTYDGTDLKLYVDGVEAASTAQTGPPVLETSNLGIGQYHTGGQVFRGLIDDARVYNRDLDPDEIASIYAAGIGACTDPLGNAGSLVYNSAQHVLQFCNGADWIATGPVPGAGGAGCSNPAGAEGDVVFNQSHDLMQYCDGVDWIAIGGTSDPLNAGLVHYWKLNETTLTNGSTIVDSIGGLNGTVVGTITSTTGPGGGNAILIDANGEYISFGDIPALKGVSQFTLNAWVKRTAVSNFALMGSYNAGDGVYFDFWSGNLYWGVGVTPTDDELYIAQNDTNWHMLTTVFDGTQAGSDRFKAYLDGAHVTTPSTYGTPYGNATTSSVALNFNIGILAGQNSRASFDNVRVYNRPLSDAEVLDLYTGFK